MGQAAHVRSLDALVELRVALQRFGSDSTAALERAGQKVQRAREQLDDHASRLRSAVRQAQDRLRDADERYHRCAADEDRGCSAQRADLTRAQRDLDRAGEEYETCRRWQARLADEAARFESRVRAFRGMSEETLSRAMTFLQERRGDLEIYVRISTGAGAGAAPATMAPTAASPSSAGSAGKAGSSRVLEPRGLLDLVGDEERGVLSRRLGEFSTEDESALRRVLANSKADTRAVAQALAKSPGNFPYELDDELAIALPVAMAAILEFDSDLGGFFSGMKNRDGVASLQRFGNGKAYEILATARRLGLADGPLAIRPGQHISFGSKAQARYRPQEPMVAELLDDLENKDEGRQKKTKNEKFWRDYRKSGDNQKTVEADLHLGIPTPDGYCEIMEDYKHTFGKTDTNDYGDEILGMAVALASGEIHEARFICNKRMGDKTHQRVRDVNEVLESWEVEGRIEIHENFDWRSPS